MKAHTYSQRRAVGAAAALLSLAMAGVLQAQTAATQGSYPPDTRQTWQPGNRTQIHVIRASNYIGTDLVSSDGRKLGDIVDYVFDTSEPQRLAYLLVMTGGFLDIGGDVRVVPAEAVTFAGDEARAQISRDRYFQIPKIAGDREQFLSRPDNLAQVHQHFGLPADRINQGVFRPGIFVTYSTMSRRDALAQDGQRIGYIDDVWINLDRNRAPFVEVTPTMNPFSLPGPERYAIPMAKLASSGFDSNNYRFRISLDELTNAAPVNDTPGVEMVDDGFLGNAVLRVTVPRVASAPTVQAAGAPTGFDTRTSGAPDSFRSTAQQIRAAIDSDAALRQANVQVMPQYDRIILAGSVTSEDLRQRLHNIAQRAAQGAPVENQVRVHTGTQY